MKSYARSEATYIIFGNKRDLEEEGERAVSLVDAAKFAQENECLFVEGSAKSGENVEEAFSKLTQTILYKIESGEIPEEVVSTAKKSNSKSLKDAANGLGSKDEQQSRCGSC